MKRIYYQNWQHGRFGDPNISAIQKAKEFLIFLIYLPFLLLAGCEHLSQDPQEREINREFMEHHMDAIVGGQH